MSTPSQATVGDRGAGALESFRGYPDICHPTKYQDVRVWFGGAEGAHVSAEGA